MPNQVHFYFDFGSPYSYLAYRELPRIAARTGSTIVWKPMLLGGVFKATGNHSPMEIPAKSDWSKLDLRCWADQSLLAGISIGPYCGYVLDAASAAEGCVDA